MCITLKIVPPGKTLKQHAFASACLANDSFFDCRGEKGPQEVGILPLRVFLSQQASFLARISWSGKQLFFLPF